VKCWKILNCSSVIRKLSTNDQCLVTSAGSTENYPDLKANEQFRDLQVQLEGTENRIAVARNRYITTVQDFNSYARQFPQVMTAKVIGWIPSQTLVQSRVRNRHLRFHLTKLDLG
jgi:Uncharacterized conserved protein